MKWKMWNGQWEIGESGNGELDIKNGNLEQQMRNPEWLCQIIFRS